MSSQTNRPLPARNARPTYIPPQPRRWHEDLSWFLLFNPPVLILALFAAGARALPSHRARFSAFGAAGFLIGSSIGLMPEADWVDAFVFGAIFGTFGLFVYGAIWLRTGRGFGALGVLLVCLIAAVVISAMMTFAG